MKKSKIKVAIKIRPLTTRDLPDTTNFDIIGKSISTCRTFINFDWALKNESLDNLKYHEAQ